MKQQICRRYPPNFKQIVSVIPQARRPGVIFSYGDKIFAPTPNPISEHLIAHEAVHGEQQELIGVEEWWDLYLSDVTFRYAQELLAHRVEYRSMVSAGVNPKFALHMVAGRLASSLYGCPGGLSKAMDDIVK